MDIKVIPEQEFYQDLYQACKFIVDESAKVEPDVVDNVQFGFWNFIAFFSMVEFTYQDTTRFEVYDNSHIVVTVIQPFHKFTINVAADPEDCIETLKEINEDNSSVIFDLLQLRNVLPNIFFESTKKTDRMLEYAKDIIEKCNFWKEHVKQLVNEKSCSQS